MKFEELVENSKKIKAPEFKSKTLFNDDRKSAYNSFIEQLQKMDRKYRTLIRMQQYLLFFSSMVIIGFIFTIDKIIVLNEFDLQTLKLGLVILFGSYLISFYMFHLKYKKYNFKYYGQDMLHFLIETKKRYGYFTRERLLYIPLFLVLDLGLYFTLLPFISLLEINELSLIVNLQIILICVFCVDFYLKYRLWMIKQKPIYDEILKYSRQL